MGAVSRVSPEKSMYSNSSSAAELMRWVVDSLTFSAAGRGFVDRRVVVEREARLPADARNQVDHLRLVLQRHERHDVAVRGQIGAGIDLGVEVGEILRAFGRAIGRADCGLRRWRCPCESAARACR